MVGGNAMIKRIAIYVVGLMTFMYSEGKVQAVECTGGDGDMDFC